MVSVLQPLVSVKPIPFCEEYRGGGRTQLSSLRSLGRQMGRQMYRATQNQGDLLPYAEAFANEDEVVWKVDTQVDSGDGGVKQCHCHFPSLVFS